MDVERALEKALTPRQRQVICLRITHDLTAQETARAIGLSNHSTVSRSEKAARLRLSAFLDGRPIEGCTGALDAANAMVERNLPNRVATWLGMVASGEISALTVMDRQTIEELQSWLAEYGDALARDWLVFKSAGAVLRERDEPTMIYVGRTYRTKWGRAYHE